MSAFKSWFDAKEIPIFALAKNVHVKSEKSGTYTITDFGQIITSNNFSELRNMIPKPKIPLDPQKNELFNWRFADDDGQFNEAFLFYDDSPTSLASESTDMDIFGENYVIFWIAPADKQKLFQAMAQAIEGIRATETNDEMVASIFLEEYLSRIYFVQHDLSLFELHQILESALDLLLNHLENTLGKENMLLQELEELLG